MNGLLFPGQGSQAVGMGETLYQNLPAARRILDRANEILGYNLKNLLFNGPQEKLTDTKYAQPAIYTCSAMYLEKIKEDAVEYEYVAGHSLGEYNALLAADVFDFQTGLKLVAARGEAMGKMNGKGTMAAVMGFSEEQLKDYMNSDVVMANLNSKTQIVISGTEMGINQVEKEMDHLETVRVKKLAVSAAFHSPQMSEAAEIMKEVIESITLKKPSCHVVSNVTGKPTKDVEDIKNNLIRQITGQVRWYDSIMAMKKEGVTQLYEVGFGDVLKRLNKTITFRPKCVGLEV